MAVTCLPGNAALADTGAQHAGRPRARRAGRRRGRRAAAPTPLLRPLEITPETHGPHGIGYAELPEPPRRPRAGSGPT